MFKDVMAGWFEKQTLPAISFLDINFTDTTVISGKKDSGKSYFVNLLIKTMSRYVLWDMRFERVPKNSPIASKKAIIINDNTIKITSNSKDIGIFNKIIFHPIVHNHKELRDLFNEVCKKVREAKNYIFIIEEADSVIPFAQTMTDGIYELMQGNIHENCGLIFVTRRLQRLNTDAVRLADNLFIFQFNQKDKEYLVSYGIDEKELNPLQKRQFYYFCEGKPMKLLTTETKK